MDLVNLLTGIARDADRGRRRILIRSDHPDFNTIMRDAGEDMQSILDRANDGIQQIEMGLREPTEPTETPANTKTQAAVEALLQAENSLEHIGPLNDTQDDTSLDQARDFIDIALRALRKKD
jgi:hypothetical protein